MKTTRVSRGGEYYYLHHNHLSICVDCDFRNTIDDNRYEIGNYFHTKKEAEAMACKIRAVLKGADVIEMPSEEDCEAFAVKLARENAFVGKTFSTRADWRMSSKMTLDWLKFKIVK